MNSYLRVLGIVFFGLVGCRSDYLVLGEEDTGLFDDGSWEGAQLVIVSPQSGDFLEWEVDHTFEAQIVSMDGEVLAFEEIDWRSSKDSGFELRGATVEGDLDVGTHAITASAVLPNGDRLAYTAGGVLVQSPYSGIYSGTLTVDLFADQLQTACAGGANLIIDPYGELVMGSANCFLSFQGFDLDGEYLLSGEIDQGQLAGEISVDLAGLFELPLAFDGEVTPEGELSGGFTGDLMGFAELDGTLTAVRVTRDTGQ